MLRKLLSRKDVNTLRIGDVLVDQDDPSIAKTFLVENITDGIVYVIHDSSRRLLKLLLKSLPPAESWWLVIKDPEPA